MRHFRRLLPVVGVILGCTEPTPPQLQADNSAPSLGNYVTTDLGNLGGATAVARGINDFGWIVGVSETAVGDRHAFLWTLAKRMQDLGTLGGGSSVAFSINDLGHVVGAAALASGDQHAFLWTATGGMQDLGTLPGGHFTQARHVNDLDQVVGFGDASNGSVHPFLWTRSSGMVDLGTFGGDNDFAWGINDAGAVVGFGPLGPCVFTLAWTWTQRAGFADLGALSHANPCGGSGAEAINGKGEIVGSSGTDAGPSHAFRWTTATGMRDLGALFGANSTSEATAINFSGQIVGLSVSADGTVQHAFVWNAVQGMRDLSFVPAEASLALGINFSGQIVGQSGSRAVLWSPARHGD